MTNFHSGLKNNSEISFLKSGIQTKDKTFNRLIERIEMVAIRSTDPILLTGPTGAGKSLLAKRMYELKKAHNKIKGNFVTRNIKHFKRVLNLHVETWL